jgi:hypothetical protein
VDETLMEQTPSESMESPPPPKRGRPRGTGKRKTGFRMDTPPWPVRAIWELASQDERKQAHKLGVMMLEHWLGRMTRRQLGEALELPPLRVWQLSQQALAGMVVGLMAQPKRPPKGTAMPGEKTLSEAAELKALRKEVDRLKHENQVLQELLEIARDLPTAPAAVTLPGKKIKQSKTRPNILHEAGSLAGKAQPKEG